jgi:hypothetical protein
MSDLDRWIEAQPGLRLGRPEAIRHLLGERLVGQPVPAPPPPCGSTEGDADLAELRRQLIRLAGKVDGLVAYTRQVEAERDALAAWAPRLEVVRRPGEHFAARQSPREPPAAARWSADPIRGSPMRPDPEAVAPARAQLAEAEAEARRREEIDVQRS